MAEIPRSQSPEPQDAPPMQSPQELVQSEPESYFESKAQHDTPAAAASNSKAGTTPPPHRASSHHRTCSHSRNSSLSHSRNQSLNSNASLTIPRSSSMSRTPSHDYKETLDAKSKDMEDGSRIINQYRMTDVIGQGAYGTVHKASLVEDPQVKFAIKEFGKTRLRKNHRSNNLRKPLAKQPRGRAVPRPRGGFTTQSPMKNPDRDNQAKDAAEKLNDPLVLIRHEIAILKKLHHPNVVTLFEVLDDPSKDSLYMVFEHCPDGPVIDIKLNESVKPLDEATARKYFVQILLGVEYLHSNDIVHRDIKPDNILLSDNRETCKIVDFGVSEMFVKPGDDTLQKSAGSPAFMSPELCTAGHGDFHGRSDDIWSFGVTFYCMVVGHLPFNKNNFYEMYESIKNDEPEYPAHLSPECVDLLQRMLCKNPDKRATVPEIREHPWVTMGDQQPIVSIDENLVKVVKEITDEELDCAICKITSVFTIARAVSKFKRAGSLRALRKASQSGSDGHSSSSLSFSQSELRSLSRTGSVSDGGKGKGEERTVEQGDEQKGQEQERKDDLKPKRQESRRMDSINSILSAGSSTGAVPIITTDSPTGSPLIAASPTETTPPSLGSDDDENDDEFRVPSKSKVRIELESLNEKLSETLASASRQAREVGEKMGISIPTTITTTTATTSSDDTWLAKSMVETLSISGPGTILDSPLDETPSSDETLPLPPWSGDKRRVEDDQEEMVKDAGLSLKDATETEKKEKKPTMVLEQTVVTSPKSESLPTPPGAGDAYKASYLSVDQIEEDQGR